MIVLDSSAVVAMMLGEAGADVLSVRLALEPRGERIMAGANYVEAGAVLAGRSIGDPRQAVRDLDAFLARFGVELAPMDTEQAKTALKARIELGKGFGSGGRLNFGDCIAYALAKSLDAPLLYVGDDFTRTDIASALAETKPAET